MEPRDLGLIVLWVIPRQDSGRGLLYSDEELRLWRDFLGGPVVKNPSWNAEDVGSTPGQRTKIPHAS